jgi:hypothetical protein
MKIKIYTLITWFVIGVFSLQGQQQRTNLPTFYLTTENNRDVSSKTTWIPGNITVVSSDVTENLDMPMTIRGRGNSTWNLAKKPYRIKLESREHLLNLPAKEKNWVLLANHADKTLIRNAVAFKVSELLGFEFTPSARFVDVYLNSSFLGNYMLTDQVQVGKGDKRVDVEKLDTLDTELPQISGGYLLEIDGFASSEPLWFTTSQALKVTIKYPDDDDINAEQIQYIKDFTNSFENVLFSQNFTHPTLGYRSMVDTTSLINWYIASELTGNPDCFWSTYIYKRRDIDKFFFGPLWDFDIAFNNDNRLGDAVRKLMRDHAFNPRAWMQRFWQDDWFKLSVNRRWTELQNDNILDKLQAYIDSTVTLINASQQQNYQKWGNINRRVYNEQFLFTTYQQGVDYLKTYLTERTAFLTESFASTEPEIPTPPFKAEDFYYSIINRGTNNAIAVRDQSLLENAHLVMWSPEQDDYSQQWEIEMIESDVYRFINRNSGLAMTGNGRAVNLIQTTVDNSSSAQKWKITPVFSGDLYALENIGSRYSVNNSGGNTANGTAVIEYDNNIFNESKRNQHWYIQKIEKIDFNTSLKQYGSNEGLSIYPNPATNYLRIEQRGTANLPIAIYSLDGQCIYTAQMRDNTLTIQLRELNIHAGIYLVKVGSTTQKLIVE